MPRDLALPPELVTAHAAALRALARSFALDEHAADDAVQETWLRALSSPPPEREHVAGWLRRVVAGFALKYRRGEGRRADHERRYAFERPEAHVETRASAETLKAVVDVVLALEEPYRETVLQRWFEGLPPRDIAVRQCTSVATVNSRLQRAHAQLRESLARKLDLDQRELRGVMLGLFGLEQPTRAATLTTGSLLGIAMTTTKMIVGATLAAALLCAFLLIRRDAAEPRVALQPAASESVELSSSSVDAHDTQVAHRVELAIAPAPASTPVPAVSSPALARFAFDVTFLVVDDNGCPLPWCSVWLGLEGQRVARWGETAWNGELHSTWRGDEPTLDLVCELRSSKIVERNLRRIQITAGSAQTVRLGPEMKPRASSVLSSVAANSTSLEEGATARFGLELTVAEPSFAVDEVGNGVITDPWLLNRIETAVPGVVSETAVTWRSARFQVQPARKLAVGSPAKPGGARIAGVVVDEHGAPLANDEFIVFTETHARRLEMKTDRDGRFEVAPLPAGNAMVFFGGRAHVLRKEVLEPLAAGESRTLSVVCPTSERSAFELVDERGRPLVGWSIGAELTDRNGTFVERATSDDRGRALLTLSASEVVTLLASPPSGVRSPPVRIAGTFRAAKEPQTLVIHGASKSGGYLFETWSRAANDHGSSVVRLWRVDSQRAITLNLISIEARDGGETNAEIFRGEGLVPGDYEVEYGTRSVTWRRFGPVSVMSGIAAPPAPVLVDAPAFLEILPAEHQRSVVLQASTRRFGMRVQSPRIESTFDGTMLIEPGEYQLTSAPASSVEAAGATVLRADVNVRSGERRALEFAPPR